MNILDFVFPKKCLECSKEGKYICSSCLAKVTFPKPVCPECLRPSIDGFTHAGCQKPQDLDGLICPWRYEGVIRKAILALKYKFAFEIANELAETLCSYLHSRFSPVGCAAGATPPDGWMLVPIPLHWHRENWRGFNQSEEIGKMVAKSLCWRFTPNLLVRNKAVTPQTELKRKERLRNVQGIFVLNSDNHLTIQPSNHLILFDDVWTTGSTLKEACKVLKRKGAEKVWGMTIAR